MFKKAVFKNFTEYWYYARYLSREQRKIIFKSLTPEQRRCLDSSYIREGWSDLFYRNEANSKIDELKEAYGYDVMQIKIKALNKKSVYVPTKFWKVAEEQFNQMVPEAIDFVMGGLKAIPDEGNNQVSLIIYDPSDN